MAELAGIELLDVVSESWRSVVQRGQRLADATPLILKRMRDPRMLPEHCARYRQEFDVAGLFHSPALVGAVSLVSSGSGMTLVFEDVGAWSLDRFPFGELSVTDVLRIGIRVCEGLHAMHAAHVIHGDIKPANIVWNPATAVVQIIDFGAAVFAVANEASQAKLRALEGTVAYMAPEQTGRMNRAIDHRADLYALGATLFELATGRPPFVATDPLELIHCHLARMPESPSDIDRRVPRMLSGVILKLLQKNPEDRYRSALGVRADLQRCLDRLEAGEDLLAMPELGLIDAPQNLTLPQKLYGRGPELAVLRHALVRATTGRPLLMLVAGYSGIGKTALIRELQLPTAGRRGHFIAGKFDLMQRNEPYSAFAAALRELVNQLLCLTDEALATWKHRLLEAAGPNGGVLVEFLPEMALVIGEQPAPAQLGAIETKNRFLLTMDALFGVLSLPEQPLVVFLDDLQWADSASLALLERLLASDTRRGLLVVGAYRDNEMTAAHPLAHFVETTSAAGVSVERMHLGPLDRDALTAMCSDVLFRSADDVRPIVDVLVAKTDGNPFFVGQFLRALAEDGVLELDPDGARWSCDLDALRARSVMENVGELLGRRLHALAPGTKRALHLASCIGNAFDLQTVAWVSDCGEAETYARLKPAIEAGLIVPTSELGTVGSDVGAQLVHVHYRFTHDRIQQAAYALENEAERARSHLRIGRRLRDQAGARMSTRAVEHLNAARSLLTEAWERIDLARRNLVLAQQARSAAAFEAARAFLVVACELAPRWEDDHAFCFGLGLATAELAALSGDYAATEAGTSLLLGRAKTPFEKAEVYRLQIWQYTMQTRFDRVLETGRVALGVLGVRLPETDILPSLGQEIGEIDRRLAGRPILALFDLPEMTDERVSVAMRLLRGLQPAAYMVDQELYALINARLVTLSLEYGNSPVSGAGYGTYGILVGPIQGRFQAGYDWGLLAWRLSEKFSNLQQRCSDAVHFGFAIPWVEHVRKAFPVLDEGFRCGLEAGELQWAGYILPVKAIALLHSGEELTRVDDYVSAALRWAKQCNHDLAHTSILGIDLAVRNLRGIDADDRTFSTRESGLEPYLASIEGKNVPLAIVRAGLGLCLYVHGRFREALIELEDGEAALRFVPGTLAVASHAVLVALCAAALFDDAEPAEREVLRATVAKKLDAITPWAASSPANFEASRLLVDGELARIDGDRWRALRQIEMAATRARAEGFVWVEVVAHERTARALLAGDCRALAIFALQGARDASLRWGATRKAKALTEELSQLAGPNAGPIPRTASPSAPRGWAAESNSLLAASETSRMADEAFDVASLMKAAAAIAQEVELRPLLASLVHTCLESAGAESVALILKEESGPEVAARGVLGVAPVLEPISLEACEAVVPAIAQYVLRRGEPVVLDDALQDTTFGADEVVQRRRLRSVIAVPLRRGGGVMGLLYLENNRMTAAFNPARVRVLDLLAVQASIAVENARYFERLQREIAERSRAEAAMRFLSDAGTELAESLDYAGTLAKVARLAVPVLADWCMIDVVEEDQRISRVASTHVDPAKARILDEVRERYPPTWNSPHPSARVLRSGRPVLRPDVTDAALTEFGIDEEHIRLIRSVGTRSAIAVPLIARGQMLGVMTFGSGSPGRRYGTPELAIAIELARRAAVSIDNSRLYRDAQQAVRVRDEFLSVASHELRTPVTSMTLALQAHESGHARPSPETTQRVLGLVSRQTRRLRGLIEDLFSVSRVEIGRLGENLETLDLAALAREVVERFSDDLVREGSLVSLQTDTPVVGRWQKDRLDQVITNLLSNARKFGAGKPIEVGVDESGGVARLWVQDHGIGMENDATARIFERFGRAVPTSHYGGLGLGLYIVREIVRAHGGTVAVETTPGQGSRFTVELPLPRVTP